MGNLDDLASSSADWPGWRAHAIPLGGTRSSSAAAETAKTLISPEAACYAVELAALGLSISNT